MLQRIDGSVRSTIAEKIELLKTYPIERGKPLQEHLAGFFRIVAAGRYRVIYRVVTANVDLEKHLGGVEIVCIGIRKEGSKHDVYRVAGRLFESGNFP